jgi:hypothetical protein
MMNIHVLSVMQCAAESLDRDSGGSEGLREAIVTVSDMIGALSLMTSFSMSGVKGNGESYIGWQNGDGMSAEQRVEIARVILAKATGQ